MAKFIKSDLKFILDQIKIAEAHASGENLADFIPNAFAPFGLRTVNGTFNHIEQGQSGFGAADNIFPRLLPAKFLNDQDGDSFDANGPAPGGLVNNTNYAVSGNVADADPRIISNLLVDQTISNPAAVQAFIDAGFGIMQADGLHFLDGETIGGLVPAGETLVIPNVTPDEGLSAGFNSWFTFFGQFFDHGLDLVTKGGNGTVFIPLQPDDPLYVPGSHTNFMVVTRATNQPGADGVLGTADDIHEHQNTTSPFIDQNQTYSSHPSHQVFLRAYALNAAGDPVATGKLITNRDLGADGKFGTIDDAEKGGMATWAVVKAQARDLLGINLTDTDVFNVPLLATDEYGNFIKGPNGFPQVVMKGADGLGGTNDDFLVEGNPAAPIDLTNAVRTGHAFLDDIAHAANPKNSQTGALMPADSDNVVGLTEANRYDNELLDAHFIAGDGRVNENIGLTAVHHVFHSEHNRLVEHTKATLISDAQEMLAGGATSVEALAFLNEWLITPVAAIPADPSTLVWNGERLFQAAKFGTEMQYQHLVFEEFARKVQPNVDAFLAPEGFDTAIDPAIFAEFAHTVYRFGHSMLTENIDRLDPAFQNSQMGLIEAFLNPLAFAASGATPEEAAGAIVRGVTRQAGNEIDEFVTEALRNNLVGLPLDLAAINIARGRETGIPSLNEARKIFFDMTNDTQLKPYASWADFVEHLKHPESLINFIAAYGTHGSITSVTTMDEKRAAATLLVLGGTGAPSDRLDFLNATGAYANASLGGLNNIDFWIGGLAEAQMPFGGLLGSTFNFVFETQMEMLQNGDRFYYLSRLAGLNFLTEMENASFAKLVMRNTDATHLPADIFSTPAYILEVDQTRQFTGLGLDGNDDPTGGTNLIPLVVRDDLRTTEVETNYLRYTGEDHVVLGGTAGNDTLIASIGDDTLWGDAGNDRLEGGDGVDNIEGGSGDDIITDKGGDDVLKGNEGNDVIHGGNGFNLILGGDGNDFIITGEDVSETFGGQGNDFILGSQMNLPTFGNEGDDWIEIGTSDGAGGDNFAPLGLGEVVGNDVFITGGGFDEVDGEAGDDIMVFSDGEDHFDGGSGYDWASYKNDPLGVTVDLQVNDFIEPPATPSSQGIIDRFGLVEGLSGSGFSDVLRGDDADAASINTGDALSNALTNLDLINGLRDFLGTAAAGADGTVGTADDLFGSGNILLGGAGSDIIEGRGGDDIIDGNRWLNQRVSVRANADGTGAEIATFDSIAHPTLMANMLNGTWNPGQLVAVREILNTASTGTDLNFDTAMYSDVMDNYDVVTVDGVTTVTHLVRDEDGLVIAGEIGIDGVDRLTNIERLQFSDQTLTLPAGAGLNSDPVGALTISELNGVLTASIAGVTDNDNVSSSGAINGPVSYYWQVETVAGSGIFQDIVAIDGARPAAALGNTFTVTPDLVGVEIRARAVYKDANDVLENVFSARHEIVSAAPLPAAQVLPAESPTTSAGIHLIRADLQFILDQIVIAENHSGAYGTASQALTDQLPNSRLPFGLRTVDGSFNNLVPGQEHFGAADQVFPTSLEPTWRVAEDNPNIPGNTPTNYAQVTGSVYDSQPREISNLIVDQTITNPAAVQAFVEAGLGTLDPNGILLDLNGVAIPAGQTLTIPNTAPDEGLSAGFNSWFTLFGQFFDHGLDLVNKGGNGAVRILLNQDDPLYNKGTDGVAGTADDVGADGVLGTFDDPVANFMTLTRASIVATDTRGTADTSDDIHFHTNQTTPFVDQNQTYTSHASHQVFLREYKLDVNGHPVATGMLLDGAAGGLPTWADIKEQARTMLGIQLSDEDILNVPLLRTDAYGKFIPGANGFAQLIVNVGADGIPNTADDVVVEGSPTANGGLGVPTSTTGVGAYAALRTNHAFLDDIAHNAAPGTVFDTDGNPATPGTSVVQADTDTEAGNAIATDFQGRKVAYDDELLDAHFITGDGRGNENIGLTTVHHIFHSEHNRMVGHIQDVALASNDLNFVNQWLASPITQLPANQAEIDALVWNGERLFQAARFSTEMQYQHLVFEEFARKVQPQVDVFLGEGQGYDTTINPAIVAEFAHVVYRFGHSMLTETVDRLDPNFNSSNMGLIEAFLNPLAFNQLTDPVTGGAVNVSADAAAGAIVRGMTRQAGNEIDEFISEALRNNLVGLPLDLAALNIARGRDAGVPSFNAARQEFYSATGDSQLKPYTSWVDFAANLRHESSIVNFIAAYGTHLTIVNATTMAEKRAAAMELVLGTDQNGDTIVPADRLDFLNATGAYAGGSLGGLNNIDFWIGGLAEKQMPFGGLLGSTFNFVFENQMEKLQNGDRFYYLERTAGQNFLTELENNSFAKIIMANTDATHLPGDVFSTPAFTLEIDPTKQFTGLGVDGRADPTEGGTDLTPLVIRNNPATAGTDTNYLRYTGEDHVVLGGTEGNDIIVSSIGDDTLWGDGGNDRLEGGDGVDMILGGAGDDILTDKGGDDNLQGGDGNDAILGGNGIDLLLGGHGSDFIVTGADSDETFGGTGNDFILGDSSDEAVLGNEGDDWIEKGTADGGPGDNFDVRGLDAITGNDVYIGDTILDRMMAEGGDDIMVGNGGQGDRYIGGSGFDWASFKDDQLGVSADFNLRAFNETPLPASSATILARFESTEGLSGSKHSDILKGDDLDANGIALSGANGSVLTNIALIDGLQALLDKALGAGQTSFGAGNIILGGDGSDVIEGRGGNDLIDGDKWLNVRLAGTDNAGNAFTADSMTEIMDRVFAGEINPGNIRIVREIKDGTSGAFNLDTAVFSGNQAEYEVSTVDGVTTVTHRLLDAAGVIIPGSIGVDGTDRLMNVERLQFADVMQELVPGLNNAPVGNLSVFAVNSLDGIPTVGQLLRVSIASVTDADNVSPGNITGNVSYVWQVDARGDGVFEDLVDVNGEPLQGESFTVTEDLAAAVIRVRGQYMDNHGVFEQVFSSPINLATDVLGVAIIGTGNVDSLTGTTGQTFISGLNGNDVINGLEGDDIIIAGGGNDTLEGGLGSDSLNGGDGVDTATFANETSAMFVTLGANGNAVRGSATSPIEDTLISIENAIGSGNNDTLIGDDNTNHLDGGDGDDTIIGLADSDNLIGGTGLDKITGGMGNDNVHGDEGDDTFNYAIGEGSDTVDGGADEDTLDITGSAHNDTLDVIYNGVLTGFEGGSIAGVEKVMANLSGGQNTLSYAGSTAAVLLNLATGAASGFNTIANVHNLTGGSANDTLIGNGLGNILVGGLGDDALNGGAGNDTMEGGAGDDTYDVDSDADKVIEAANSGKDTIRTVRNAYSLAGAALAYVENLTFNGAGSFKGTGNSQDNMMTGGASGDSFDGGAGNDTVMGDAGSDWFIASHNDGSDTYMGGADIDTLDLSVITSKVVVNSAAVVIDGVTDTLNSIENIIGGKNNDIIMMNGVDNMVNGQDGNDIVNAGEGNDTVNGGKGNDNLDGEGGNDNVNGDDGKDTLNGAAGNDTLNGGAGADKLIGGIGDDKLMGGSGADRIIGGQGNDIMNGGANNDRFIFARGFGDDTIQLKGFDANPRGGQDKLDISAFKWIDDSNFDSAVNISAGQFDGVGAQDTRVTIGENTITLIGVNSNAITEQDFILAA